MRAGLKPVLLIALGAIILRAAMLWGIELYSDEAYYWTWSLHPAWGYFDHPPMVAWLAGFSRLVPGEIGLRLPFLICGGLTVVLSGLIAAELTKASLAPVLAALLTATAPMLTLNGALALPDAPQALFYAAAVWALVREKRSWTLAGVAFGLAMLSKYPAALLGVAVVLVALFDRRLRADFATSRPWIGGLIAGLIFLPCVLWNAHHDFVSFRFQFEHGFSHGTTLRSFLEFVLAVIAGSGVIALPVALWFFVRNNSLQSRLVAAAALVPIAVVTWSATRGHVEVNWPAVSYPLLCAAVGAMLAESSGLWSRAMAATGVVIGLAAAILYAREVRHPTWLSADDAAITRLHGWKEAARKVAAASRGATYVYPSTYQNASELAFYAGWRRFGATFRRRSQFNLWAQPPAAFDRLIAISDGPLNDREKALLKPDPARRPIPTEATFDGAVVRSLWVTPLSNR